MSKMHRLENELARPLALRPMVTFLGVGILVGAPRSRLIPSSLFGNRNL